MANKVEQALVITAQKDQELSKEQKAFNKLTKRIENLAKELEKEKIRLDSIDIHFRKLVMPIDEEMAKMKLNIVAILHESAIKFKYNKNQKESIRLVILFLCGSAFEKTIPTEEEEAVYDYWSESSYKEELRFENEAQRAEMAEELSNRHGIDIDISDFDDSPEGFAKFHEKFKEELEKKLAADAAQSSNKKKTNKQLEKEALQKEEEALQLKSLRSIYISLAKVLHPDANNEVGNTIKEELMKKVTKAYAEKDLPTLLKLEMEWAASEKNSINTLSDSRLKLYIASLKDRVKELEYEKNSLKLLPKYKYISYWAMASQREAINSINKLKRQLDEMFLLQKKDYTDLKNNQTKKGVFLFVEEIVNEVGLNEDLDSEVDEDFLTEFWDMFEKER